MPIILLSKSDEEYLQKCATQLNFAYGIIIGQVSESKKKMQGNIVDAIPDLLKKHIL